MRKLIIGVIAFASFYGVSAQAVENGAENSQIIFVNDQYRFDKEIVLPIGTSVPQIANFPRDLSIEFVQEKKIATIPVVRDHYIVTDVATPLPLAKKPAPKVAHVASGEVVIHASAYTAAADETGSGDGITASGARVQKNRTLACPPQYRFGTQVTIEGYGTYTCEDRGGAIKGNRFDIYMETKPEAFAFGRRRLVAYVGPHGK